METPFFSIIIPTYNRAKNISGALKSVLTQTYTNWELIIIDDGSTDNTKEIVNQFKDARLKYFYQTNQERSCARNNGIKLALGRYICLLDSDDFYLDNHLQSFYNHIQKHQFPKAIFFNDYKILNDKIITEVALPIFDKINPLSFILLHSIIPDRVCIEKSIFDEFQFDPNINIGEDTILWAQITLKYPLIQTHEVSVVYHIHDDNSVNLKNNVFRNRLDGLNILFKNPLIKARLNKAVKRQVVSTCYHGIARFYEAKNKYFLMSINIMKSIFYAPKSEQTKSKIYMLWSNLKK